jgi:hypothetical protein
MEWRLAGETEVLGENLTQRHFVHHKSRAAAVESQRLTAWAMAQPYWSYLLLSRFVTQLLSIPVHEIWTQRMQFPPPTTLYLQTLQDMTTLYETHAAQGGLEVSLQSNTGSSPASGSYVEEIYK